MDIIEYIKEGQDNAVTGDYLCRTLGINKRKLRELISFAQMDGNVIINLQDGKGYFRPTQDETELVEKYLKQEKRRALSSLAKIKACRQWKPDQLNLTNDI